MTFAASEDSDQPVHLLSRISLCCSPEESSGPLASLRALSKDWSDWADAEADQSLRQVHSHFVGFCHAPAQTDTPSMTDNQSYCSDHMQQTQDQNTCNVLFQVCVEWNGSKFWNFKCKKR